MIHEKFRTDIVGDLDYEELIADIYFQDIILAVITQENGFQHLRIKIYPPHNQERDFSFDEFETVICSAKQRLWELRKIKG